MEFIKRINEHDAATQRIHIYRKQRRLNVNFHVDKLLILFVFVLS